MNRRSILRGAAAITASALCPPIQADSPQHVRVALDSTNRGQRNEFRRISMEAFKHDNCLTQEDSIPASFVGT